MPKSTKAVYTTGTVAKLTGINEKTIINYDTSGLVQADRTEKNRRVFSKRDIFKILLIKEFIGKKNLTYEGMKVILSLIDKAGKDGIDVLKYILPGKKIQNIERFLDF